MNGVIIMPTYNEAANLEAMLRQVLSQPTRLDILVVDDSSPDGTGEIAERLARNDRMAHGRLHVLHRAEKDGLGRAYLAGLHWALERDYQFMIEMDADFSHDPVYLQPLIAASGEADLVLGSRYLTGISVVNWPMHRVMLSWGANRYVRFVTGLRSNDCTSGYRLFRREALEAMDLATVASNGYSFHVEMVYRASLAGCRIAEVPIIFTERHAGASKMSRQIMWEAFWMPLRLRCGAHSLQSRLGALKRLEEVNPTFRKAA